MEPAKEEPPRRSLDADLFSVVFLYALFYRLYQRIQDHCPGSQPGSDRQYSRARSCPSTPHNHNIKTTAAIRKWLIFLEVEK